MGTTCKGAYRGRDEKRPNVWELHVQGPTEGGMSNILMCGNYMYRTTTERGMRNVLMCGNYMYRGLQREG